MKFAEAEDNGANAEEKAPARDSVTQPQYIRQTWDVSRFINLNAPEEDWDT